ncbi:MAG TPA: hypothetical protein VHT74_18175 [Acetobacteraceae bacterium]|nr:hypothetical protein [Acetobacteraceae bacterium]
MLGRQERIASCPSDALVRLLTVEPVAQRGVECPDRVLMSSSPDRDAANRDAERTGITRQPKLSRCAGARDNANLAGQHLQVEHVAPIGRGWSSIDALAIDHKVQIRVAGQREARSLAGSFQQPPPHLIDDVSTGTQAACGGRPQPELAFWNNQRLPSSR